MIGTHVGLDIGTATVSAVRIGRLLKGIEIKEAVTREITAEGGDLHAVESGLTRCLTQLRAEGWGERERVMVSVPEALVSAWVLDFPFVDPRKIAQVVPFEMEDVLPFELEEVAVEQEILSSRENRASVLAMAIRKEILDRRLRLLSLAGFEVSGVTVGSLALKAYYDTFIGNAGGPVVLINVELDWGTPTVTLCAIEQGYLYGVRTILGNCAGTAATGIAALERTVLAEMQRTLHVWEQKIRQPFSRVDLCGRGAELSGVRSLLERAFGIQDIEVRGVQPRNSGGKPGEPGLVVATGLAILSADGRRNRLDFGRGRVAAAAPGATRARWVYTSIVACLVLLLAASSLWLHYRVQTSHYEQAQAAVWTLFHESFPGASSTGDEVRQAQGMLAESQKRWSLLGSGDLTVLEILSELTSRLPKETRMEVQDLVIESGRLRLEAEADSFESVDRIKRELARSMHFKEVSVSDAKAGPIASRVRFRIQILMGRG